MLQCDEKLRTKVDGQWVYNTRVCDKNQGGESYDDFVQNRTARLSAMSPWAMYLAPGKFYRDNKWADLSGNNVRESLHFMYCQAACDHGTLGLPGLTLWLPTLQRHAEGFEEKKNDPSRVPIVIDIPPMAPVLKFNRSNFMVFPEGSIPDQFTIGVRARQTAGDDNVVFGAFNKTEGNSWRWTLGFEGTRYGVFRVGPTYSQRGSYHALSREMHSIVGRNSPELPVAWTDGAVTESQTAVTWSNSSGSGRLAINPPWPGGSPGSDVEVSEVVIFDRHLSAEEAEYLSKLMSERVPSTWSALFPFPLLAAPACACRPVFAHDVFSLTASSSVQQRYRRAVLLGWSWVHQFEGHVARQITADANEAIV